jgi:hypothetical protein
MKNKQKLCAKYALPFECLSSPDCWCMSVAAWVYRKARRGQSLDLSDLVPLGAETESGARTTAKLRHTIGWSFLG